MNKLNQTLTTLILATSSQTAISENLPKQIQNLSLETTLEPGVAQRWVQRRYQIQTGRNCPQDQHLFWNYNGHILDTIPNNINSSSQKKLDNYRITYYNGIKGGKNSTGYPFAGNCSNKFQHKFEQGSDSYFQTYLKGTWNNHTFKTPTPIREIFKTITNNLRYAGEITYPKQIDEYSLGQYVIESGGEKKAKSSSKALGIMQILPENLSKICKIPKQYYYHRIAQIECNKKIHQKNYKKLKPNFDDMFGHMPQKKQNELISLLTIQSYHTGPNRINKLIDKDSIKGQISQHFANNHNKYSAADIAFAIMFHNYGKSIKIQSLTYTINVRSALNELKRKAKKQ